VGGRTGDVVHRGGAPATDHLHPEEVRAGGVVQVRERPAVGQGDRPGGRDLDRRRGDDGRPAVDVVGAGVGTGGRAGHRDQVAVRDGAQLQLDTAVAGRLRHGPLEPAGGGVTGQGPADRGLERVLEHHTTRRRRRRGAAATAGRLVRLRRHRDRVPRVAYGDTLGGVGTEHVHHRVQRRGPDVDVTPAGGLLQQRVVEDLAGLEDADTGHRGRTTGADRAVRPAGRVRALGDQVEPVVERAAGGVHLGVRDGAGPAVGLVAQRRVVHEPDRADAGQVRLLADLEVRRVVGVVGEVLGHGAEDVAGGLVQAALLVAGAAAAGAAGGGLEDGVAVLVGDDVHGGGLPLVVLGPAEVGVAAVPGGVDRGPADAGGEAAAAAVDAVTVQPGAEHVPLPLHGVEHVHAGGLEVGALAVAPDVVVAG